MCSSDLRSNLEIDVVAVATDGSILAIGEAKHTTKLRGVADLERLEHIRALLPTESRTCRLLLFSASGFSADLMRIATSRPDLELIDLARLYGPS